MSQLTFYDSKTHRLGIITLNDFGTYVFIPDKLIYLNERHLRETLEKLRELNDTNHSS